MRLMVKILYGLVRFFIYGIIWGILYDNAGYMKSIQDVQ